MSDIVDLIYRDHDWFRRQFFHLDEAASPEELTAIWEPLATRLETHADAEETIFYPQLLVRGDNGDPEDETDDAIKDHNKIRDAVAEARRQEIGSPDWFEAVGRARKENGEHLEEEEREAIPDFIKSTTLQLRQDLAAAWLRFEYEHPNGRGIDGTDKDPKAYIRENS